VVVGVSDVIAKSIVHRILEPAFQLREKVRIVCREARSAEAFMAELAVHSVDVVLADAPAGPGTPVRTFSHPLGECGTSFFAAPRLARTCRRGFPGSLDRVPVLLPSGDSTFRRALEEWFQSHDIRPEIIAELDDLALASVLGEQGLGALAAPDVTAKERQGHPSAVLCDLRRAQDQESSRRRDLRGGSHQDLRVSLGGPLPTHQLFDVERATHRAGGALGRVRDGDEDIAVGRHDRHHLWVDPHLDLAARQSDLAGSRNYDDHAIDPLAEARENDAQILP
jgi:hypothetical protein